MDFSTIAKALGRRGGLSRGRRLSARRRAEIAGMGAIVSKITKKVVDGELPFEDALYQRAAMLEVLNQDFIRTARAKGLPERVVIFKHALRNALIPIVTILGLSLPDLFGGAFIIETIFAWPGMGRLGVQCIFQRNYPVIPQQ